VRGLRAPTRHQTPNPGPGIMTPNPGPVLCPKCGRRSALEALVGLAGVKQVTDPVVRVLATAAGLEKLSISPAKRAVRAKRTPTRNRLFTPKKDWEWKNLVITIRRDGLHFGIRGDEVFQSWAQLRMRPVNGGEINSTLALLGRLANGGRITQRRRDVNERQQVSVVRRFLKDLIGIKDDPFKEFSDGWGVKFRVDGTAARKQVAEWEDGDEDEEIRPDAPKPTFDPYEQTYRTIRT